MHSLNNGILELNQYQKSKKAPFTIYSYLKCLTEKSDGCKNNAENSSPTKVTEHISSGVSMSTISWFKSIENNHDISRYRYWMKGLVNIQKSMQGR